MGRRARKFLKRNSRQIVYAMAVFILVFLLAAAAYTIIQKYREFINTGGEVAVMAEVTSPPKPSEKPVIKEYTIPEETGKNNKTSTDKKKTVDKEEGIYTFLQGPKSWGKRIDWSGVWGKTHFDGSSFGAFGCGLCCLANVYSTQGSYQCTPVDMYRFAKEHTRYSGGGAIAWKYMANTLKKLGFKCELKNKPTNYQTFRKQVAQAGCSIVLVSSSDSRCYWNNTPGHYVTIFLYDRKTDTVFLADSGDPDHNRRRVGLRKIYKSLKTSSQWQYLNVGDYDKTKDIWKHTSVNGRWVKPEYIK